MTRSQQWALAKLLHGVAAYTRATFTHLENKPRKASAPRRRRLLYVRADTLSDADLDRLVTEISLDRWWAAAERATQPQLPLIAAE